MKRPTVFKRCVNTVNIYFSNTQYKYIKNEILVLLPSDTCDQESSADIRNRISCRNPMAAVVGCFHVFGEVELCNPQFRVRIVFGSVLNNVS